MLKSELMPAADALKVMDCIMLKDDYHSGKVRAYDDEYTGLRWTYGYINRPFAIAHQPKGFVLMSYRADVRVEIDGKRSRHGTIDYPFPLSDDEVYSYELFLVGISN